ncbi:hypothetical protein EV175_002865 [Coemansia sp. RSA 1933]|nr:hypothetical protein EV175_002865 [Coemansia sp. RSA 1933]
MQANTRTEKAELRRVMWSPYPDHYLTLWAMPPESEAQMYSPSKKYGKTRPATQVSDTGGRQRRNQWWQVSRDFKVDEEGKRRNGGTRGKTTEVFVSHRLNFGNQSILRLSIPVSSVPFLGGLVELRMPQNKLRRLPESLFLLTQLEILNLENNYLDADNMTDYLWRRLVNLRVLFLAGNMFRQLPPSLGRMPRLFYLDVCDNRKLAHIPMELLTSPSIGTLAANRCSPAVIDLVGHVPLLEMAPGFTAAPTRVPPLAGMCIRQVHLATEKKEQDEGCRAVAAACERIRRNPDDYAVSGVLLAALDSVDVLALCSVCSNPVFYPSFSIARRIKAVELPVSWHCCSAACRDKAAAMPITKSPEDTVR